MEAGKRLRAVIFQSILSTVHLVRRNISLHSITAELAWNRHGFDIIMFFRESGTRRNSVQRTVELLHAGLIFKPQNYREPFPLTTRTTLGRREADGPLESKQ